MTYSKCGFHDWLKSKVLHKILSHFIWLIHQFQDLLPHLLSVTNASPISIPITYLIFWCNYFLWSASISTPILCYSAKRANFLSLHISHSNTSILLVIWRPSTWLKTGISTSFVLIACMVQKGWKLPINCMSKSYRLYSAAQIVRDLNMAVVCEHLSSFVDMMFQKPIWLGQIQSPACILLLSSHTKF